MIFKHILGAVEFKASGSEIMKFINDIRKQGILFKKFSSNAEEIKGIIYGNDFDKIKQIAKAHNLEIEVTRKRGLRYKLGPYKKRYGIIAGLIFSFGMMFYLSNIVLKINITGCDDELYKQVSYKLEEYGISPGKFIPSINFDNIETNLVLETNKVSWASIRSNGGIITVNIHESAPKPYIIPRHDPCNLVSTRNAKIVRVEVGSGQLMKIVGEGVNSGEVLISGIVNDANGKPLYLHSIGKVIGEYTESFVISQPLIEEIKIDNDDVTTKHSINFFSINIPLYFRKDIKGEYTYKESKNSFSFLGKKLPVGMTTYSYYPYTYKTVTFTEEMAKQTLYDKLAIYENNFLANKNVINKNVEEVFKDDIYKLKVKYVVQSDITKESEIFIKK